jgi:2-polyprenyl-6-methoxyphenol hydroxylase-like FAD-dependent oxidoreductase
MTIHADHFDVIIVGGRPAGATLAARLGQAGLRVLLLEKVKFPNAEIVSSPTIAGTSMALLDEIGIAEQEYTKNTPKLLHSKFQLGDYFSTEFPLTERFGRQYFYAIDRGRFDQALWEHAAKQSGVTVRDNTPVVDLIWDGDCVRGVQVQNSDKSITNYSADCVVGADGRFSFVARKVKAETTQEATTEHPTSIYFAYWKNVKPVDSRGACMYGYSNFTGVGVAMFDSADNRTAVVLEGRADALVPVDGISLEDFYMRTVKSFPHVWTRLANAEAVLPVRGMRNIGHFYRVSHGNGWALVGDAVHAVDPLDGQGIYDALFSAKILAQSLIDWKLGKCDWNSALAEYDRQLMAETLPLYKSTLARRKMEFYDPRPEWMVKTIMRWLITDEQYLKNLSAYLSRALPPDKWLPMWLPPLAIARGIVKDIRAFVRTRLRLQSAS